MRTPTSVPGVPEAPHRGRSARRGNPGGHGWGAYRRGFTLVELLVVMLVLGVATALISLRLAESPRERGQRAAEALATALEHAALAAQWRGRNLLWRADPAGWQFLAQGEEGEPERWHGVADQPELRPGAFPTDLRLLGFQRAGQARAEIALLFNAHGINDPFELRLALPEQVWQLRGNALGRVSVESKP